MGAPGLEQITLDYLCAVAGNPKLLTNLSAVAAYGDYLWTASDEGRTVECLKRDGAGYRLHDQVKLDALCKLPNPPDEADIESLSICGFGSAAPIVASAPNPSRSLGTPRT
jgi:hypothetical protein